MSQQRAMANDFMKDIRLFDIVHVIHAANKSRNRKTPLGEQFKKLTKANQCWHSSRLPPCGRLQDIIDSSQLRNLGDG